jgi:DNA polymerase III epsilon subunit-like protein
VASTEIHGITRKDVAGAPDAAQVLYDFIDFSRGTVLAAHDAPKDISFLKKEMSDYGTSLHFDIVLDTLRFSRKLYPEQKGHSLDHIIERLNFRPTTKFRRHRALYDAESTANALRFMLKKVFDEKFYLLGELTEFLRKPF